MLDRRMNQNIRTCTGCQIPRGRTPQVARDGLGWVWRRPRQLSEADGLLRLELSQMMAPTFPGSPGTRCLAVLAALRLNLGPINMSIDRAYIASAPCRRRTVMQSCGLVCVALLVGWMQGRR